MAIRAISRREFFALGPQRNPSLDLMVDEKAWFVDDEENLIGVLFICKTDKDWNYVVLGRDERGAFRWIDGESSFPDRESANRALFDKMTQFAETGEAVFPQGD